MTPSLARTSVSRRLLPAAVALLLVTALLPARFTRWLGWFADPVQAIVAPVSAPVRRLTGWLLPAGASSNESEVVLELRRQIETLTQQHLRDEGEIEQLKREMAEALNLRILNPDTPVRQLSAPVIGTSSDLASKMLTVRAGAAQGVTPNTVVVTTNLQLLGRVVRVAGPTCDVQPITSKSSTSAVIVRVMADNAAARPLARLDPVGDGTLRGPVEAGNDAVEIRPGTVVRLDDPDRWPRHAHMLVVGVIEDVGPDPQQPLRRVITVRPTVRLERVSDVVLRVPEDTEAVLGGPATGAGK